MTRRYKVRMHESGDGDGSIAPDTLVLHIGGSPVVEAQSIDEAESSLRKQVETGKLARGCVYQICPAAESTESLLSLAVALDGNFRRCSLDAAKGLYSEFRRISYAEELTSA